MGMLEEIRVHRLVERLLADRTEGVAFDGAWDKSLTPQTMVEAYRVQDSIIRRMRTRGTEPGGWRIALTTDAAQKQHDVVHPIVGPIWRQGVLGSPSTLPGGGLHSPVAGAELALRIGTSMGADDGPWDRESVAGCVGAVALAIGIFDDRHISGLAEYTIGLGIADLAGSAACVLGPETNDLDVLDHGPLEFTTTLDGRDVGVASTSTYLAHPYEILSWVATHLNVRRRQLEPGDVVLLGCPGDPFPLGAGDQITVVNATLGTAALTLEGQPNAVEAVS
jgi:2-keto-4-pentenoate hydratase